MSSSGKIYPAPTYIPPLPVFNPIYFPQSFGTTTIISGGGGGGGGTNIFPLGLTSGNVITMNGGTGGGGGTGAERTITGLSQIEWADYTSTNPATITGSMVLNGGTLDIGSNTPSSGINVNLQGTTISVSGEISVDNTQSNIGDFFDTINNFISTGIGLDVYNNTIPTGDGNSAFGTYSLKALISGADNTALGGGTLQNLTTGNTNTAVGAVSLSNSILDNNNTAVGYLAGTNLNGNGTNSNDNTFIGYNAGINQTTGSFNVALGSGSGVSSSASTLSNTIAIGSNINPTATNDIVLGTSGSYVKFFNTGNGYGLSTLFGGTDPNFSLVSANALLYNAQGVHIMTGQATQIQGVYGSATAGILQISAGTNGGGSLQLEDSSTNPPTNTGYGNFASVNGLPFYYSPSTSTWSQLATNGSSFFSITTPTGSNVSGYTQWEILTGGIPNIGNSFNFSILAGSPTNQVYPNNSTPLTPNNSFSITTGTAVIQNYTQGGIQGYGYLFQPVATLGSTETMVFTSTTGVINNIATTTYLFRLTGTYDTAPLIIRGITIT
jgi:hypothetical protein